MFGFVLGDAAARIGSINDPEIVRRLTQDFPRHRLDPYSKKGVQGTLAAMRAAACGPRGEHDIGLANLIKGGIVRGVRQKDYIGELAAFYCWTCRNYRYVRDPVHIEWVADPRAFYERGITGDCDEAAVWMASGAQQLGNPCRFVIAGFKKTPRPDFSHVFTEAYCTRNGCWVTLDPVAGPMTQAMLDEIVWIGRFPLDPDMGQPEIRRLR